MKNNQSTHFHYTNDIVIAWMTISSAAVRNHAQQIRVNYSRQDIVRVTGRALACQAKVPGSSTCLNIFHSVGIYLNYITST